MLLKPHKRKSELLYTWKWTWKPYKGKRENLCSILQQCMSTWLLETTLITESKPCVVLVWYDICWPLVAERNLLSVYWIKLLWPRCVKLLSWSRQIDTFHSCILCATLLNECSHVMKCCSPANQLISVKPIVRMAITYKRHLLRSVLLD